MPEMTTAQFKTTIADLEDKIESLTRALKDETQKRTNVEQKLGDRTKSHDELILANNFSRIAHSMGFPAAAITDVLSGVAVAGWTVNEKGEPKFRDQKSGFVYDDVTPEGWLREQAGPGGRWHYLTRQGAFQTGGGGGQSMASGDLKPGQPNPWVDAHWNDTEQALLINADRAKAERIAKAAGSFIGAMPLSMRKKTS